MIKKILLVLLAVILLVILGYLLFKNIGPKTNKESSDSVSYNKTLIVYFSAQNHTKNVAEEIAKNLDADILEIEPKNPYSEDDLNYNNSESRVVKEYNDESLRNIELKQTKIENWGNYDLILIWYPIWWGIAAWPINTFVESNDFTGKTVIPFCTSASSGIGQSGKLLENLTNTGTWQEGKRFSSNYTTEEIKNWTDKIND